MSTEGIVGRRGDMGAGGCVGIFEGVSLQCDRVTLWTFGGTEITFWGGASLAMGDGEIWEPSGNG